MHSDVNKYRAALRFLTHPTVWKVLFAVLAVGMINSSALAGCAHRTENTSVSLDPFGNPLAANVLKVYSGGEFQYYAMPLGKSCKGPNCNGLPPSKMTTLPPVVASERCDLTFLSQSGFVRTLHYCNEFVFWSATRPTSPVLDGLLRPPTV